MNLAVVCSQFDRFAATNVGLLRSSLTKKKLTIPLKTICNDKEQKCARLTVCSSSYLSKLLHQYALYRSELRCCHSPHGMKFRKACISLHNMNSSEDVWVSRFLV